MRHFVLRDWPLVDLVEDGDVITLDLTDAAGEHSGLRVDGHASATLILDATPRHAGTLAIEAGTPEPKEQ